MWTGFAAGRGSTCEATGIRPTPFAVALAGELNPMLLIGLLPAEEGLSTLR